LSVLARRPRLAAADTTYTACHARPAGIFQAYAAAAILAVSRGSWYAASAISQFSASRRAWLAAAWRFTLTSFS